MDKTFCEKLIFCVADQAASRRQSELQRKVRSKATHGLTVLNPHAAASKFKKREIDCVGSRECIVLEWCADSRQLPVMMWRHRGREGEFELCLFLILWSLDGNAVGLRFELGREVGQEPNPHAYWHCQHFDVFKELGKWPGKHTMTRNCAAFDSFPAVPLPASSAAGMVVAVMLAVYGRNQFQEIVLAQRGLARDVISVVESQQTHSAATMYPRLKR